jgi:hypothetical protein
MTSGAGDVSMAVARISADLADTLKLDDIEVARGQGSGAGLVNWRDYVVSTAANAPPAGTKLMGDSRAAYLQLGVASHRGF